MDVFVLSDADDAIDYRDNLTVDVIAVIPTTDGRNTIKVKVELTRKDLTNLLEGLDQQ